MVIPRLNCLSVMVDNILAFIKLWSSHSLYVAIHSFEIINFECVDQNVKRKEYQTLRRKEKAAIWHICELEACHVSIKLSSTETLRIILSRPLLVRKPSERLNACVNDNKSEDHASHRVEWMNHHKYIE